MIRNGKVSQPLSRARAREADPAITIDASMRKKPAPKQNGRPSKFSPEIAAEICKRISGGESLRSICSDAPMPCRQTVIAWTDRDSGFRENYLRARECGADAIADDCLRIADDLTEEPQSRRVRVETRLKLLSKWMPKRYGDRVEVESTGRQTVRVVIGGNA